MPTYQYRCTECGHDLEAVQKFTDHALTECPNCRGQLRKVFNAVGVVFKGSGFYRNDSRSADAKVNGNGAKGDSDTKTETTTKTETKTEKKTDGGASPSSDGGGSSSKKNGSGLGDKQQATASAAPSSTGAKTG